MRSIRGLSLVVVVAMGATLATSSRAGSVGPRNGFPAPAETVLRLARSKNGLTFTDAGAVFARRASAPDLVPISGGGLLAVFDYAAGADDDGSEVMALSASNDQGRSWSPGRPLEIRDSTGKPVHGRHGDLVRMSDGRLRLFFSVSPQRSGTTRNGKANGATVVRSALTHDGLQYRLDPRAGTRLGGRGDLHPTVGRVGSSVHLYLDGADRRKSGGDSRPNHVQHAVSDSGHRFDRQTPIRIPDADFIGSLVPRREGVRAYVSGRDGVRSLVSDDGENWRPEPGLRIADGWDPAVVRLEDGSFLMLYCAPLKEKSSASSALVTVELGQPHSRGATVTSSGDGAATGANATPGERGDAGDAGAATETLAEDGTAPGETATGGQAPEGETASGGAESASLPEDEVYADSKVWDEADHDWVSRDEFGFAPPPDFARNVDYIEWYRQYLLDEPIDNAYYAYAAIMPLPWPVGGGGAEWPELRDMFNDGDLVGPPGPWDPVDHPEWESSNQAMQGLLEGFREAAGLPGYATPVLTSLEDPSGRSEGPELLLGILLPPLSSHRALARATLADAWRAEDGEVSSSHMLDAWETTLGGAGHLDQGATIIEDLVSMAERGLVQENARWALQQGVFSDEGELEAALDTLREFDQDDDDNLVPYVRGEYAAMMDATQFLFSPPGSNGEPQYHSGRLDGILNEEYARQLDEKFSGLGPEDVYATIDAMDAHYRNLAELMQTGYPEVRAADIQANAETYRGTTPITEEFVPDLAGYYQRNTRSEASRRATQLAYATHLYKARHGQWPESLDDVALEYGERMRTDPFTGGSFGYRVDGDGPTIYSAGENGLDDGGVHSPRWDDEITNEAGSDDFVFWPPQVRPNLR